MRILIVGLIVLALSVAGISTYLIRSFSSQQALEKLEKEAEPIRFRVLLAARAVLPGETLARDALVWQDWPGEPPNAQYIVAELEDQKDKKIKQIVGSVARRSFAAGEPILASKLFKRDKAGFMAGVVAKGKRAITVTVTPASAVAGFILPGDRVDVLLVHDKAKEALRKAKPKAGKKTTDADAPPPPLTVLATTTETILRDILVLAVDQALVSKEGNPAQGKTMTLELTPKQTEMIVTARSMGQLTLTLRGLGEENPPTARTFTTDVEVSPFISAIENRLKGKKAETENVLAARVRDLEKEMKDRDEIMNAMMRKLQKQNNDQARDMRSQLRDLEKEKKKREEELEKATRELQLSKQEPGAPIQKQVEIKKSAPKLPPVEEKKEPVKIEIFRGGTAKTQEVTVK